MSIENWKPAEAYIDNNQIIHVRAVDGGFMSLIDPDNLVFSDAFGYKRRFREVFPALALEILESKTRLLSYLQSKGK